VNVHLLVTRCKNSTIIPTAAIQPLSPLALSVYAGFERSGFQGKPPQNYPVTIAQTTGKSVA